MGGSGDGVVVVGVDGVVGVGDATSALILPPRKSSMSPVAPSRSFDEAVMTFELDARRTQPFSRVLMSSCRWISLLHVPLRNSHKLARNAPKRPERIEKPARFCSRNHYPATSTSGNGLRRFEQRPSSTKLALRGPSLSSSLSLSLQSYQAPPDNMRTVPSRATGV